MVLPVACSFVSINPIKLPSDTLSPTLTFNSDILPEKGLGISTLDLSLSIVIIGSFLLTSSPSLIKISIISTFLKSPISGTLISVLINLVVIYKFVWPL